MKNEKISRGTLLAIVPVIIGLLLLSTVAHAAVKTLIDPVVVRVNGEDITETEFLYFLMGKYGDDIIDQLVEHMVLSQEATNFGLELDPQDGWDFLNRKYTSDKLATLKGAFDLDTIAKSLAREVLSLDVINKKSEELIDLYGIEVSDDDILQFYLDNIDNLVVPESARFSWIVTSDKAVAEKALGRLDAAESFTDVAKELSEDEMTSGDGGEVGVIAHGQTKGLPQVIEEEIFTLSVGEYSEILQVGENYFIIQTNEKREAYEPNLQEMKPLIETKLLTRELEEPLALWLKELSDKAVIEIVYPIFKDMGDNGGMVPEGDLLGG